MDKLKASDLTGGIYSHKFGPDLLVTSLQNFFKFGKFNKLYNQAIDKKSFDFIDKVIKEFNIDFYVSESDLMNIPKKGAFITISNHPLGGFDGLILLKIMSLIRPDFKFLANNMLNKIEPIQDLSIPINLSAGKNKNMANLLKARKHLENGAPIGIFPAGETSVYNSDNKITDAEWKYPLMKFINQSKVKIVPIYFQSSYSNFYHLLGNIHPIIQAIQLPKEILKKNKTVNVRIGNPINIEEQEKLKNIYSYGRFLRAKTYSLGTSLEIKKFFKGTFTFRKVKAEKIIAKIPDEKIIPEIENLIPNYQLFENSNYKILCAPPEIIPNALNEIGRLRELTFREIGEGTNQSIDLDEFDLYYNHLIIWDSIEKRIVGSYRIGKGDDILKKYGVKGFYTNTLFKIKKDFYPIFSQSIELGRSFIVKEYQRKPLPLFLLWKGILYFILSNKEYRYLIGPASISNEFSEFSKSLIVQFFETYYKNKEFANYIIPRKPFKHPKNNKFDKVIISTQSQGQIAVIDKTIQDIEQGLRLPVLLKKYISLNAQIICFNIDPKFNNCLDGLIILDILKVPQKAIKSLSKEINDETILERFNSL